MLSTSSPELSIKAYRDKFYETAGECTEAGSAGASAGTEPFIVPPTYTGPRLEGPKITMDDIKRMILHFRREQKPIHFRYAVKIILEAYEVLRTLPNVVEVGISAGQQLTVVGDVHGQFMDLINLFELNGYPSPSNPYLFNGDYVDRGACSCEVILTLFALKALFPEHVHLARGNHESKQLNVLYGFYNEVRTKYGPRLIELFRDVFKFLPLAHVVAGAIFVVHAGLPTARSSGEPVLLNEMQQINRKVEIPTTTGGILCDMMWADPQEKPGRARSKRGVAAYNFGPDVTQRFLEKNGFQYVIRSHEVKAAGYEWAHDGRLVTLFSAPNYGDVVGNDGAYIHLSYGSTEPKISTFHAYTVPLPARSPSPITTITTTATTAATTAPQPAQQSFSSQNVLSLECDRTTCAKLEQTYMDCTSVTGVKVYLANNRRHTIVVASSVTPLAEDKKEEARQRALAAMIVIGWKRNISRNFRPVSLMLFADPSKMATENVDEDALKREVEIEASRLRDVMEKKHSPLPDGFDYVGYHFTCYQQFLEDKLNELYAGAAETVRSLRASAPVVTQRLRAGVAAAMQRVNEVRSAGQHAFSEVAARSAKVPPLPLIAEFIRTFNVHRAETIRANDVLRAARSATDSDVDAAVKSFRETVKNIVENAQKYDESVPSQITSGAVLGQDVELLTGCSSNNSIDSNNNNVSTKEEEKEEPVWEVACTLCGDVIEHSVDKSSFCDELKAEEEKRSHVRYRCLACSGVTVICSSCYDPITTLLEASRKKGLYSQACERFSSLTECFSRGHPFVREEHHLSWVRKVLFPPMPSPGALFARAATEFGPRPFLGVNPQSDLAKKSPGLRLLETIASASAGSSSLSSSDIIGFGSRDKFSKSFSGGFSSSGFGGSSFGGSFGGFSGSSFGNSFGGSFGGSGLGRSGSGALQLEGAHSLKVGSGWWYRYSDVHEAVLTLARGLFALGIPERAFVCCFMENSLEHTLIQLTCAVGGFTFCGFYSTMSAEEATAKLKKLEAPIIFCDSACADKLLGTQSRDAPPSGSPLRHIVVVSNSFNVDYNMNNSDNSYLQGTFILKFDDVADAGSSPHELRPAAGDELFAVWVTPKSLKDVAVTAANVYESAKATPYYEEPYTQLFTRSMSYSSEIIRLWDTLSNGGKVGVSVGAAVPSENDFYVLRPTHLVLTKEFWEDPFKRRRAEIAYAKSNDDRLELIESIFGPAIRTVCIDYSNGSVPRPIVSAAEGLFKGIKPTLHSVYRTCETGVIAVDNLCAGPQTEVKVKRVAHGASSGDDGDSNNSRLHNILFVRTPGMPTMYYKSDVLTSLAFIKDDDSGKIFFNTGNKGVINSNGLIMVIF